MSPSIRDRSVQTGPRMNETRPTNGRFSRPSSAIACDSYSEWVSRSWLSSERYAGTVGRAARTCQHHLGKASTLQWVSTPSAVRLIEELHIFAPGLHPASSRDGAVTRSTTLPY